MGIVTIPYSWMDQYLWQTRKNSTCRDAIGDVYFIDDCKIILFRN